MSTGLFAGGKELTATEARAAGFARGDRGPTEVPPVKTPRWDHRMYYMRDGILDLLTRAFGDQVTMDDVASYVRDLPIVDHIPFPEMPPVPPSEHPAMEHRDRMRAISDWENQREITRRKRELYNLDGIPVFVPSWARPDMNSSPADNRRRVDFIEAIDTKDLNSDA